MIHELDLIPDYDGEIQTVKLDTSLTLFGMRKMQKEGLISKTFLTDMAMAETDPSKINADDMLNAPYIAYRNANPNGMEQDEFESKVNLNLQKCSTYYAEIIAGEASKEKNKLEKEAMANSFRKATSKKK